MIDFLLFSIFYALTYFFVRQFIDENPLPENVAPDLSLRLLQPPPISTVRCSEAAPPEIISPIFPTYSSSAPPQPEELPATPTPILKPDSESAPILRLLWYEKDLDPTKASSSINLGVDLIKIPTWKKKRSRTPRIKTGCTRSEAQAPKRYGSLPISSSSTPILLPFTSNWPCDEELPNSEEVLDVQPIRWCGLLCNVNNADMPALKVGSFRKKRSRTPQVKSGRTTPSKRPRRHSSFTGTYKESTSTESSSESEELDKQRERLQRPRRDSSFTGTCKESTSTESSSENEELDKQRERLQPRSYPTKKQTQGRSNRYPSRQKPNNI